MDILIFTPTYADKLHPATVASVAQLEFDGRVTWEVGRLNQPPAPSLENILAQYQRARSLFLLGSYDALLTLEHDMTFAPDTLSKLAATDAPVIYAPYMLRHGLPVLSVWRYENDRNLGMSLSLYPAELAAMRRDGVGRVCGVGFGCTLIRRQVLEQIDFRRGEGAAPDLPFAADCLQAGFLALGRFDAPAGHMAENRGGEHLDAYTQAGGAVARVLALQDVTVTVDDKSQRLVKDHYYSLPLPDAEALVKAGYVKITNAADARETTEAPAAAERAVAPTSKRRVKR